MEYIVITKKLIFQINKSNKRLSINIMKINKSAMPKPLSNKTNSFLSKITKE